MQAVEQEGYIKRLHIQAHGSPDGPSEQKQRPRRVRKGKEDCKAYARTVRFAIGEGQSDRGNNLKTQ